MVTAADEPESRLRGGIEGALQYITKPFDPQQLVAGARERARPVGARPSREQRRQVQLKTLARGARPLRAHRHVRRAATRRAARARSPASSTRRRRPAPPPRVRAARERVGELTPKQRQLLEALATRTPGHRGRAAARHEPQQRVREPAPHLPPARAQGHQRAPRAPAPGRAARARDRARAPGDDAPRSLERGGARLQVIDDLDRPGRGRLLGRRRLARAPRARGRRRARPDRGPRRPRAARAERPRGRARSPRSRRDLGAGFHAGRVDVGAGPNLEARARDARYGALEAARVEHRRDRGARRATPPTTRPRRCCSTSCGGAARPGLAGMPTRRGRVVRPLLGLRRADTARDLRARLGLTPLARPVERRRRRTGGSGCATRSCRCSTAGAGRDLAPVLARQADVLRAESDLLDELARAAWPGAGEPGARRARRAAAARARPAGRPVLAGRPAAVARRGRAGARRRPRRSAGRSSSPAAGGCAAGAGCCAVEAHRLRVDRPRPTSRRWRSAA